MRLTISKKTHLALCAIGELSRSAGRFVPGSRLASSLGTSAHRVPQVMQPLVVGEWVASAPGRNGGYRLAVDLDDVSLLDVVAAIEGAALDDGCVLRGGPCRQPEPCPLHDAWSRAREELLTRLEETPASELCSK